MINIVEELNKHPEELKKIGLIFCILNRIEGNLNGTIQIFFSDFNQLRGLIFNQALLDEKIFQTLENKRLFLLKIIQYISEEAKEKKLNFEEKKWKDICKSIQELQKIRNELAHKFLFFQDGNTAGFILRKNRDRIEEEKKQNKKYGAFEESFETKKINLDKEIKNAEKIFQDSEKLFTNFLEQVFPIIASEQKVNIPDFYGE